MAKTAKFKHTTPSTRSRASRRASSPSLNLDKSLTSLKPPKHSNVLAAHSGAGISKPPKKGGRILKRKQKRRLELGKEKAEERMGKMEVKVERVGRRREVVGKRNADWDELNEKIMGKKNAKKQLAKEKENGEDGWEDEDENVDAGAVGGMKEALNTGASRQEGRMTVDMDGDIEEEIT